MAKAAAARLVKTGRVRADTTVVEANVACPTDSGLLARGVARMAKTIARIKAAGLAAGTTTRDRTRAVHRRARDIAANLRRRTDAAKDEVRAINRNLVGDRRAGRGRGPGGGPQRSAPPGPSGRQPLQPSPRRG